MKRRSIFSFGVISTIVLSLLATVAQAAGSGSSFLPSGAPSIHSNAVANHTDLSVSFLSQIFGTVGNVLHGATGQMLGKLFYWLNQGILVVAAVWLAYTTLTIILKSAQEGSFMGANRNVAIVLLKIALGFGLLMPNPTTGYTIFQDVVMKVVIAGVSLADETWSHGLQYVQDGGAVWAPPEQAGGSANYDDYGKYSILHPQQASSIIGSTVSPVFMDEVCMYASNALNSQRSNNTASYSPVMTATGYAFPGTGNTPGLSGGKETPACGTLNWQGMQGVMKNGALTPQAEVAQQASSQLVNELAPAAKRYVCSTSLGKNWSDCADMSPNITDENSEAYFGALIDYVNTILPLAQSQSQLNGQVAKRFIDSAQQEGWLTAGRYYWDLAEVEGSYGDTQNIQNYHPSVSQGDVSNLQPAVASVVQSALEMRGTYDLNAEQKFIAYANTTSSGKTGGSSGGADIKTFIWGANLEGKVPVVFAIMSSLIDPIVNDFLSLFNSFNNHAGRLGMTMNPILFMHHVGVDCMAIAGDIWITLAGFLGIAALATTVCQAEVNLSTPLNDVANWLKPVFMMLALIMLTVGFVLGYYVPMYPYLLFTFGVIGWLVAVIEAMVAAPLVCLGLTHPEGHDFLGSAQQSLMLLLGVFLRPVLMVIGLIAGMILSYVSLRIVLYTYSHFISDLFYAITPIGDLTSGGAAVDNSPTGMVSAAALMNFGNVAMGNIATGKASVGALMMTLLGFPLLLVVFAGIVFVVTNYCFSLIFALPDNILRWIGAPTTQGMAAQMAQQIQGIVSSFGDQSGKMIGRGVKAYNDQKGGGGVEMPEDDSGGDGGAGGGDGGNAGDAGGQSGGSNVASAATTGA